MPAQSTTCASGRFIGDNGTAGNGRIQVCLPALKDDPAVQALLAHLTQLRAESVDAQRSIARLLEATNQTSRGLSAQQLQLLADSISRKLSAPASEGHARTLREVERVRLSMEDFEDKRSAAGGRPEAAQLVNAAIAGAAGDAIARLDFEQAGRILESLGRIERDVKLPCASDPELLKLTRGEAQKAFADLRASRAETRCADGWRTAMTFRDAAERADKRGDLNAACLTLDEFKTRALQVLSELGVQDSIASSSAQLRAMRMETARQGYAQALTRAKGIERGNALRYARSDTLRKDVAQADRQLASAEGLAAQDRFDDAQDLLTEARNVYRQVESIGANYAEPLMPLPKRRREPRVLDERLVSWPGALCP